MLDLEGSFFFELMLGGCSPAAMVLVPEAKCQGICWLQCCVADSVRQATMLGLADG